MTDTAILDLPPPVTTVQHIFYCFGKPRSWQNMQAKYELSLSDTTENRDTKEKKRICNTFREALKLLVLLGVQIVHGKDQFMSVVISI